MMNTSLTLILFIVSLCNGSPLKVIDATYQSFSGGRAESPSGTMVTVNLQVNRSSKLLEITGLVIGDELFPVRLWDPGTGDVKNKFRKGDTLMTRVTVNRKLLFSGTKKVKATLAYRIRGKERTLEIYGFRRLEPQIRRNP